MIFSHIFPAVLLAAQVSAHGAVTSYEIGGTKYPGYFLPIPFTLPMHST
jgi:hypothetical protein